MRLLLGIFDNSFYDLRDKFNCYIYGDWNYDYKPTNFEESGIVAIINNGASISSEIYFDITHIKFNLTEQSFERSVTVSELYLVITTPEYLNKTTFFKDGEMFPTDKVLEWFLFDPFWKQFE